MAVNQSSIQNFIEESKSMKIFHKPNENSTENPENKNRYSILLY